MDVRFTGLTLHVEAPDLVALADSLSQLHTKVDQLLVDATSVSHEVILMSAELDNLTAKVNETKDVEDSAIVLLNQLSSLISSLKDDPVALQTLANDLKSKSDQLAAAVVANTPSAT